MTRKMQTLLFSFIIFLALILRLPYLVRYHFGLNMDEAVFGIMAQDILRGKFSLFFYGQGYFGPIESLFAAPFFLIFSSSTLILRISVLILTLLSLILFWRGFRLIVKDHNGLMALSWLAISPIVLGVRSIQPSGHMGGLFCGSLIFYLSARIIKSKKNSRLDFGLWGLVVGFGLWMHPGTLIYVIACGFMLILNNPRSILAFPFFLLGCFAGGFPFWIETIRVHFGTFNFGQGALSLKHLSPFITDLWQSVLNMNTFLGYDTLPKIVSVITSGGIIILLLLSLAFVFVWKDRTFIQQKLVLVFAWLVIVLTLFAYSFSQVSRFEYVSYRYYIPILIGLAFIFDLVFTEIGKRSKNWSLLLFLGLVIINLWTNIIGFKNQNYLRYEVHFEEPYLKWEELLPVLKEKEINRAYVDFFEEGPINFVTREAIITSNFYNSRYPRYSLMVDETPNPAFIFPNNGEAILFKRGLDSLSANNYSIFRSSGYTIFSNIEEPREIYKPIAREGIQISAFPNNHLASGLLDDNMATTWSTGEDQKGNEYLSLDLGRETELARVDLISKWHDHLPAHMVIETSLDKRDWTEVANVPTSSTLYWAGVHPVYKVLEGFNQYIFPKKKTRYLRIKQIGSNPNSWELAEIYLYSSEGGKREKSPMDFRTIVTFLQEKGIKRIISDLFFSARVIGQSGNKITANVRYNESYPDDPRAKREFSAEEMKAIAVHQKDLGEVLRYLDDQRWHYQLQNFGKYNLIYQLVSPLATINRLVFREIKVNGSHNQKDLHFITDSKKETAWKSMAPRRESMFISCDLNRVEKVSGIILDPGKNLQDVSNELKIYHSLNGNTWEEVKNPFRFHQMIHWTGSHLIGSGTSSAYTFLPVKTRYLKIINTENNNIFYWSIGELSILGPKEPGSFPIS